MKRPSEASLCRSYAVKRDELDPIGHIRSRFETHESPIYLDGNSLGRMPSATPAYLERVAREQWGRDLVLSWEKWIDWSSEIGNRIAASALGAEAGTVTVSDSTTVNLYKLASAAVSYHQDRKVLIVDADDFPTNRYIARSVAESAGLTIRQLSSHIDEGLDVTELESLLDDQVALIMLSSTAYRSGAGADIKLVNEMAHRVGALVLWDVSHSVGLMPLNLEASGTDLAVGATYKYLNGGPGSPAFLYVRPSLQKSLEQPISGWFSHRSQFDMSDAFFPAAGIQRFLSGTPHILSLAPLGPALDILEDVGIERVSDKSVELIGFCSALVDSWLVPLGFDIASPIEPTRRGGHITLRHEEAWRVSQALREECGVICDYREPSRLRIAPAPLYTRFVDVWDAMFRLSELAISEEYLSYPVKKGSIT